MPHNDSILIVDDETLLREAICEFLGRFGYAGEGAGTCAEAMELFRRIRPEAVVIDYALPDGNALELMDRLKAVDPVVPCIVLTGHGSIDLAVKAIKNGAEQFLTKPVELTALRIVIERAIDTHRSRKKELAGKTRQPRQRVNPFLGTSERIRELQAQVERIVHADCPVLIMGETGSGKGVLARWIHDHSSRAREAFVDMNCAGFARELLETELFGHERGAFTGAISSKIGLFEVAHRGTIFLDEVGDMDTQLQPKLLKVVEERRFRRLGDVRDREVDTRLIAATHQDLAALVRTKAFRADLYFRINTVSLRVPALRERAEDIAELAQSILRHIAIDLGRPDLDLASDTLHALSAYAWPGNVRELRNVLERAALLCDGNTIQRKQLQFEANVDSTETPDMSRLTLAELERLHIQRVLELEDGHVARAAVRLGVPRSTLYHKLKEFAQASQQPALVQ
jgi:DNA-binding NtrC family response regulator